MSKVTTTKKAGSSAAGEKKASTAKATESKTVEKTPAKTSESKTLVAETKTTKTELKETSKPENISVLPACTKEAHTDLTIVEPLNSEHVAKCAYLLWEQEGYQHGKDREYWLRAEEQVRKELAACSK